MCNVVREGIDVNHFADDLVGVVARATFVGGAAHGVDSEDGLAVHKSHLVAIKYIQSTIVYVHLNHPPRCSWEFPSPLDTYYYIRLIVYCQHLFEDFQKEESPLRDSLCVGC